MIACGNAETCPEVVDDCPEGGLPLQRSPESGNAASEGNADDEDDLMTVLAGDKLAIGAAEKLTFSQLTCLYQLAFVMGVSVM